MVTGVLSQFSMMELSKILDKAMIKSSRAQLVVVVIELIKELPLH